MKKYKEFMDRVKAPDTLHQRLLELEEPERRPALWKQYGAVAAALVLAAGLGSWALAAASQPAVILPEAACEPAIDLALEEPGDLDLPGEKTLGGYDVTREGCKSIVTHYVLPYIEYGDIDFATACLDWDIPAGAVRRDLTQDEIVALLGGEDAVNTHLDWGGYELTGWAAWYEDDGSFWGTYLYGYAGPLDHFEFGVTAGQMPPSCYYFFPGSVTQEIRGLTVTADKYDGEHGCDRRVSFMKVNCGYRFDLTSTDAEQAELLASRLVARIADKGLALSNLDPAAPVETYICTVCGSAFPAGTEHFHPFTGVGEPNWEDGVPDYDSGCPYCADGTAHTHPYDPSMCEGYPTPDPSYNAPAVYTCADCGVTVPAGDAHYHTQDETYTCPICGETCPRGVEHSHELCGYPPASATQICETCGESYAWGTVHNHTCETCGQSYAAGTAHSHGSHSSGHHGNHR